jgi:uncharacterized protein (TIGR02594 family)
MTAIDEAKKYLGLNEVDNAQQLMTLFKIASIKLSPASTPWCAAFINAIEKSIGHPGTGMLNARSFLTYGKKVDIEDAQPGDIVVFKRGDSLWEGHVTYYVSQDMTSIKCLGGNQGNCVCYANYPKNRLLGVRRWV